MKRNNNIVGRRIKMRQGSKRVDRLAGKRSACTVSQVQYQIDGWITSTPTENLRPGVPVLNPTWCEHPGIQNCGGKLPASRWQVCQTTTSIWDVCARKTEVWQIQVVLPAKKANQEAEIGIPTECMSPKETGHSTAQSTGQSAPPASNRDPWKN